MAGLFDDMVPVPDCTEAIELYGRRLGLNTPSKMANEMLREARQWQREHPDGDVLDVITPPWKEYIKANL
jgi:hypothetical protein